MGLHGFTGNLWEDKLLPPVYLSAQFTAIRLYDMLVHQFRDKTYIKTNGKTGELVPTARYRRGDSCAVHLPDAVAVCLSMLRNILLPKLIKYLAYKVQHSFTFAMSLINVLELIP